MYACCRLLSVRKLSVCLWSIVWLYFVDCLSACSLSDFRLHANCLMSVCLLSALRCMYVACLCTIYRLSRHCRLFICCLPSISLLFAYYLFSAICLFIYCPSVCSLCCLMSTICSIHCRLYVSCLSDVYCMSVCYLRYVCRLSVCLLSRVYLSAVYLSTVCLLLTTNAVYNFFEKKIYCM